MAKFGHGVMTTADIMPFAWWRARQLRYNVGLAVAGVLAFICYVIVCLPLLPRVLDSSEIEVSAFTTLFLFSSPDPISAFKSC